MQQAGTQVASEPHPERSRSHSFCRIRRSAAAFRNRPDSIDVPQNTQIGIAYYERLSSLYLKWIHMSTILPANIRDH